MNLADFFGQGWDDPRSDAILGLAQGLMTGGMPGAIEGVQRARDAGLRRQAYQSELTGRNLANERSQLELSGARDAIARSKTIRDELAALSPPRPTFSADGADALGVPTMGGVPMFSQIGRQQPAYSQARPYVPSMASHASTQLSAPPQPVAGQVAPGSNQTQAMTERLLQQAQVYARNGDFETSNKLLEQAAKWAPQVHGMEVGMRNGQPVNVVTFKDGTQQVSAFAPEPKTHYLDTGGGILPLDARTNQPLGAAFPKSLTPGERASNAVALGNLQVSRDRLALDREQPQYMQTEQGIVALPKRPGAGPIMAETVTGPNGEPLTAPLKQIPSSANTAIQTNLQNLQRARDALALVRGQNVGTATGDRNATGWKGYLPNSILNRADPAGVDARAAIADLGSLTIHDRSGAAVTAAEFPRLAPFIPQPTDDAATVEKKLQRFEEVYQQEVDALRETYSREQGYKPNPVLERAGRSAAQAMPLPADPTAQSLQRGQAYQLPNGETAVWDGMRFKGQR
ncbi:hypothetical protein [Pseudorhodoferax sp.]|uniref:hypothetical protein n=1 Tax=Pseudorhodoferax sp. TaxID=1993553 RepID=UPI002DD6488A|nr:hypothetical protein [Pseudorhodoferax sp.]